MSEPIPSPETETVLEPEIAQPSPYLFTLDDLVSEHDLLLKKEAEDRALVDGIESPNPITLKAKLIEWAKQGFPDGFSVFSIEVNPPSVCSDGVSRGLFDYIAYVAGMSIADKMARLTAKLQGMYILCSYSGNTVTFHVFRGTQPV